MKMERMFKNRELLKCALTHKSWINEHQGSQTNERLEFLGDAILEFVVSEALYRKFPDRSEGYLTTLRSNLVNTKNLAVVGKRLGIGEELLLSKGEEEGGGRNNPSLIANTMEAVIGALYLDQGLPQVSRFITENLLTDLPQKLAKPLKDPKSRLQEEVQKQGLAAPRYKVLSATGPDHQKLFILGVFVNGEVLTKGEGANKASAEQAAAAKALVKLRQSS
jgi:ribonuclease-3